MRRYFLILALLGGCTQYPNTVAVCKGQISLKIGEMVGNVQASDKEEIGMRIENDRISLSGNVLIGAEQVRVCRIGSIEFAKKDEIFFDTSGCNRDGKEGLTGRIYGTYNYITRKLNVSHQDRKDLSGGSFVCRDAK
ncbi:MAG: hypothetical protein ABSF50_04760 [Burkholderiaceae bacterium]|jgi:hypothetical protein